MTINQNLHAAGEPAPAFARIIPFVLLLFVGSMIALTVILGKMTIANGIDPLITLFLAITSSGAFLLLLSRLQQGKLRPDRRFLEYGFCAGALFVLPNMLSFLAVSHVGVGYISFTLAFPILLTYVLALLFKIERFSARRASAVTLGLVAGTMLVASKAALVPQNAQWAIVAAIAPILIAFGNIYRSLRWPQGRSPISLAGAMLFFGGVLMAPLALLRLDAGQLQGIATKPVLFLFVLQFAAYSALYLAYFALQKLAGAVYLSQIGSVAALVGTVIAVAAFGEAMPAAFPFSAAMVVIAVALFQSAGQRQVPKNPVR
ncbi:DMT family transporter [Polycladidibacter hongkongensis]|uniref:DMT family transporter n=1 Tax=Polycladidibacter hongkongensis TaxID=1647556 RepID=UPI000834CEAF|nr:DMT family transporter [Pseudovibrio hongkongensis]